MRRTRPLYASAAASIIAYLAFLPGVSRKPLFNSPLEWFPVLSFVAFVVCLVAYGVSAMKTIRWKGYPRSYGFLLLLGPLSFPAVLGLPNKHPSPNAGRRSEIVIASVSLVCVVAIAVFHTLGFKIYGKPVMFSADPPAEAGWVRVLDIDMPGSFRLADGTLIDLSPYEFTARFKSMTAEAISEALFNVPLQDLYLMRSNEKEDSWPWVVRVGNRFIHSYSEFFPERNYGYYESDLSDHLFFSGIMEPAIQLRQNPAPEATAADAAVPQL